MKKFIILISLIITTLHVYAQTTTVSGTVVDSDSTVWTNGSWSVTFVPNPSIPNISVYNINGTPLSPSVINQSGALNGSGAFSFSIYQNAFITPVGSSWKVSICPNAVTACGALGFTAVGSSMDISSSLTPLIPPPRFHAISGTFGYTDAEAILQLIPGNTYWNVVSHEQRWWNGAAWITWSGGVGTPCISILNSLQYNNSGTFGCSGLTDGLHFAFGIGATLNSVPTSLPDGGNVSPNAVVVVSETTTSPNYETGHYTSITTNPSTPANSNSPIASLNSLILNNSPNYADNFAAASWNTTVSKINSPNLTPSFIGVVGGAYNQGTAEVGYMGGISADDYNLANATVDQAAGVNVNNAYRGGGTVTVGNGYLDQFIVSQGSVTTRFNHFHAQSPSVNDTATIGTVVGLQLDEQSGSGIANAYQIKSDGLAPSLFVGPLMLGIQNVNQGNETLFQGGGLCEQGSGTAATLACFNGSGGPGAPSITLTAPIGTPTLRVPSLQNTGCSTTGIVTTTNTGVYGCEAVITPIQLILPTSSLSANTCTSPSTVTMPNLIAPSGTIPGSTFSVSYEGNPSSITGWGASGGLSLKLWVSAANTLSWEICNATGSSITPGALNVDIGAR
jgi:hypothetical protein